MGHKERPHLLRGMVWRGSSWPALVPEGPWTFSLVESGSDSQSPGGEPARSELAYLHTHTHSSQGHTPESQKAGQLKVPLLQTAKKPFIKTPVNRQDKPHVRPSTFLKLTNALVHTHTHVDAPKYIQESWVAPWKLTTASEVGKLRLTQAQWLALRQSVTSNGRQCSRSQCSRPQDP